MLSNCAGEDLRVPWTARRSNQSILKEINPEYSSEGLMLKLKLQLFCPPDAKTWLIGKDPDAGEDWRQEEKWVREDEMDGWYHWLNGHSFEQTLGDSEGLGSLACCSPWDRRAGQDLAMEQQARAPTKSQFVALLCMILKTPWNLFQTSWQLFAQAFGCNFC